MKLTQSQLKQIIKEELEVVLTNEEAGDLFGEEVQKQLDDDMIDDALKEESGEADQEAEMIEKLEDKIESLSLRINNLPEDQKEKARARLNRLETHYHQIMGGKR